MRKKDGFEVVGFIIVLDFDYPDGFSNAGLCMCLEMRLFYRDRLLRMLLFVFVAVLLLGCFAPPEMSLFFV